MGRRLLIIFALGAIAVLAASASASARTAYVTIVPAAGPPGTAVTVTGAGFPARRRARIILKGEEVKLRVSRTGAFTARLSVPFSALGNLNLVSRTKGRRVLNRFAVATGTGPVSELSTSRGQRLRWTVGASAISVQGRGFKKRARLKLRWLGRTLTLRTNRRGRFLAGLALPTSGESHPATVRIGSLRLRFRVVGSFGSGSPTPVGGAGTSPPVGGTSSPPPGSAVPPAPPGPPPPVNTALPVISGLGNPPLQGQTAKASTGTWTGTKPISYAYQWQRCDPAGGEACSSIPGATSSSYKTTATDVGSTMRVVVTASNANGATAAASNPSAEIQPPPPTTGTVAKWSMESTASMTDSVGGHTGTTHSVGSDPLGFSGAAYSFNGSSSYVNVPSGTGLNPGNANVTITIHFKTTFRPPSTVEDWDLIRKGLYVDGAEYKMEYYPSGQVGCAFRGSQAYTGEHPAGPTLDDGVWHTLQCVKTSTGYSTIVDGNSVYSANITIGSIANGGDVVIGARPGSEFFHGSLDEASISLG